MPRGSLPNSTSGGLRTSVRVVVIGDRGTGKSSLIAAAATESFPDNVPPVLPPTRLPADYYPDGVPVTIIDTSSSLQNKGRVAEELQRSDAVVLTYACDQRETLVRLSIFWLLELRRLEVKVPVIIVGCKLDMRDEGYHISLEEVMAPIMQRFREIETCIECSAANLVQVPEVFYYAQRAVLHPTAPLFDQETQTLKPRCVRALKRIFILCDRDEDDALNDAELNEFQVKCFNAPLQPVEIVGVKKVVQEKVPEGVNEFGLTLTGFLFLHALFIEKGRLETIWTVLRNFGYNDEIKLREEYLSIPFKRAPDQSIELTNEAMEFVKGVFSMFDIDNDGALRYSEVDDLFSTAPENPWEEAPYRDAAEKTASGNLSLSGFLSEWALMTLLDPAHSLANLIYLGYSSDPASALRVTRRRSLDSKKKQSERNVFKCLVFGPKRAGKSALLKSFLGRPYSENYSPTSNVSYAVNLVDRLRGNKKTLVLQEIPEDGVKKFLSSKESLAICDAAVFVYDSSVQNIPSKNCRLYPTRFSKTRHAVRAAKPVHPIFTSPNTPPSLSPFSLSSIYTSKLPSQNFPIPITQIIPITMAKPSLSLILTISVVFFFIIAYSAAPVRGLGGGKVGGRTKITDVETNKEVQDLGKYSVNEYNRQQHKKGSGQNGGGDLKFRKVVAAEKQVVSGIKYYLKIATVTSGGAAATYEAQVVVQPWKKSKQLLHFGPSAVTK